MHLKSQNSGVLVKGEKNASNLDFFGVFRDIIEYWVTLVETMLFYLNVIVGMCPPRKKYWIDNYGFFLINSNHKLWTNEKYVLRSRSILC